FVVFGGGRLAVEVALQLSRKARVVVLARRPLPPRLELKLGDRIGLVVNSDIANGLRDVGLAAAHGLVVVSQQPEGNLQAALIARNVAECPVVLHAFDPAVADQIERRRPRDAEHSSWRAFSMAHLAAPEFVAAALIEDPDPIKATMRLGEGHAALCRL